MSIETSRSPSRRGEGHRDEQESEEKATRLDRMQRCRDCGATRHATTERRTERVASRFPATLAGRTADGAQFAPHATDLEGSRSDDAGRDEEENKDDTAKAVRAAALGWRTVGGALSGLEQLSLFLGWKASAADHHDGKPAKAGG